MPTGLSLVAEHHRPGAGDRNAVVLLEDVAAEVDHALAALGAGLDALHGQGDSDGVPKEDRGLVGEGLGHQTDGGALEDAQGLSQSGADGRTEHTVGDALLKRRGLRKARINVQGIVVPANACKIDHVSLGHRATAAHETLTDLELRKVGTTGHVGLLSLCF